MNLDMRTVSVYARTMQFGDGRPERSELPGLRALRYHQRPDGFDRRIRVGPDKPSDLPAKRGVRFHVILQPQLGFDLPLPEAAAELDARSAPGARARDSYAPYLENALDDPIPHYIPDPPPPWVGRQMRRVPDPDPVPLVIVTGLIRDERIEIDSVLRLTTGPATGGTRPEGTSVELLDEQGNVLERSPLRKMNVWACCECGEGHGEEPTEGIVQALLPDPGRGVSLRLVRNGEGSGRALRRMGSRRYGM